ncbi:MAG: hypothetical protein MH825_05050 [Cyanobacteria bacterium]|nr:hypothetical protein [Cyanobacteriota bacterium]
MNTENNHSPLQAKLQANAEEKRAQYLEQGFGTSMDKNRSLMRFMSRQEFAKIHDYTKPFETTSGVAGSITDCGVYYGKCLMTYATLSAALEPYNCQCKVYGFDTFEGNASYDDLDSKSSKDRWVDRQKYTYDASTYEDLMHCIGIFDEDRPFNHLPKVELIKGDLVETAKSFILERPESLLRITHLPVNLYKTTRAALESFFPRLFGGGLVAVHGLNNTSGVTKALLEILEAANVKH